MWVAAAECTSGAGSELTPRLCNSIAGEVAEYTKQGSINSESLSIQVRKLAVGSCFEQIKLAAESALSTSLVVPWSLKVSWEALGYGLTMNKNLVIRP